MPHRKPIGSTSMHRTASIGLIALFVITFLYSIDVNAQSKWGFEQYNYIRQPEASVFVPIVHFESRDNWYAEVRYNYEDARTLSFFGGKTLSGGRGLSYSITPMGGYSIGNFTGISAGMNNEAEWKNLYFSAQSQYSFATRKDIANFFFNWSELGYMITDCAFTGLALQYTYQEGKGYAEPGVVAGISFKNISIPFYLFNPFRSDCYFVAGLNYEYHFKKKFK